tara:strand:- start:895 stop:1668 length:774 start_codon:yes stop_codon:yes gene_type:complete
MKVYISDTQHTTITMTTQQYTYDFNQEGVKCRHSEDSGWEPIEPNCLNCGYKTEECGCGDYKEGWYVEEAKEEEKEKEFSTKNLLPAEFLHADPRFYTSKYQVCCSNWYEGKKNSNQYMGGCVLKKGKKISPTALENKQRTNPEWFANLVGTTILPFSLFAEFQTNQSDYEDITSRLDRQMLRYNFKDRIPKGKHIHSVLVPSRSNPKFKNCPNYDIPFKVPVMMGCLDAGAMWMPNGAAYAMNPVGDAIIILKADY